LTVPPRWEDDAYGFLLGLRHMISKVRTAAHRNKQGSQIDYVLSNRNSTKQAFPVLNRIFWDAGSFRPVAQFNEIPDNTKGFIANGVGLRALFFRALLIVF
jgi:hypothetical protein